VSNRVYEHAKQTNCAQIKVRLRPAGQLSSFYPFEFVLGTLLHELVHNEFGPHDQKFYKLLDSITEVRACAPSGPPWWQSSEGWCQRRMRPWLSAHGYTRTVACAARRSCSHLQPYQGWEDVCGIRRCKSCESLR
jgi:hypothetical protein